MKNLSLFIIALLGLPSHLLIAMDAPDGWQPQRPSQSGSSRPPRPRPTAVNYGATTPLNQTTAPADPADNAQVTDAELNFFMNPVPAAASQTSPIDPQTSGNPTNYHGFMLSNNPVPTQPQVTNPMHIINTQPQNLGPAATAAQPQRMTPKERDRLNKIEKDLDKIEEVLKEMLFDAGATALSAAGLDFIGAAFAASNSVITVPKLVYYYGNMQKHIFFLSSSKTSPEAKERLKKLVPRLKVVSRFIAKGPEILQRLAKKVSDSISNL